MINDKVNSIHGDKFFICGVGTHSGYTYLSLSACEDGTVISSITFLDDTTADLADVNLLVVSPICAPCKSFTVTAGKVLAYI